jgi:Holliday junction resolvase RusA-like endonuclease
MYQFEIAGKPVPQQQTQFRFLKDGRRIPYNPCKVDIERIRWFVRPLAPLEPIKGPVELQIIFYLPIPVKTSLARKRQMEERIILPIVPPDEDNLSYLVTNALKGIVYEDDAQVCKKVVYKFYSENPRTHITVRRIETIFHNGSLEVKESDAGNL